MVVREILWTKRANASFDSIIDYIADNYGGNVTKIFVQRTYEVIERLAQYPKMGTV